MKPPPNLDEFRNEDPLRFLELVTRALVGSSNNTTLQEEISPDDLRVTRENSDSDDGSEGWMVVDVQMDDVLVSDDNDTVVVGRSRTTRRLTARDEAAQQETRDRHEDPVTSDRQQPTQVLSDHLPTNVTIIRGGPPRAAVDWPDADETHARLRRGGKRTRRRYENNQLLLKGGPILHDDDEQNETPSVDGLSMFRVLYENPDHFHSWITMTEEESDALLKDDCDRNECSDSAERRYSLIDRTARNMLRKAVSSESSGFRMIAELESSVLQAVFCTKSRQFERTESNKFARLIVHSVAKFHELPSESISVGKGKKRIRVDGQNGQTMMPKYSLTSFLKKTEGRQAC